MLLDGCPDGWHKLDGETRCFKFIGTSETYDDASAGCKDIQPGSDLAYVDTAVVHAFIRDTVMGDNVNDDATWVGLKDQTGDDTDVSHKWLKTGHSVHYYGYDEWCAFPSPCPKASAHRCVWYLMANGYVMPKIWVWADVPCHYKRPYICEIGTVRNLKSNYRSINYSIVIFSV